MSSKIHVESNPTNDNTGSVGNNNRRGSTLSPINDDDSLPQHNSANSSDGSSTSPTSPQIQHGELIMEASLGHMIRGQQKTRKGSFMGMGGSSSGASSRRGSGSLRGTWSNSSTPDSVKGDPSIPNSKSVNNVGTEQTTVVVGPTGRRKTRLNLDKGVSSGGSRRASQFPQDFDKLTPNIEGLASVMDSPQDVASRKRSSFALKYGEQMDMEEITMKHPFMLHPTSSQRLGWDIWVMVLLIYVALMAPYRIGFDADAEGGALTLEYFIEL